MPLASQDMRAKIACHLPAAFEAAIESYNKFFDQTPIDDAKAFTAHHSACKAAIAHMQLLIKLADWVENDASDEDIEMLKESRSKAEDELNRIAEIDL